MERSFEDGVADLQAGLRAIERLFRATAPEDERLAIIHGRIAGALREVDLRIETYLFEGDDLEVSARLARFDRLLGEMPRERKLRLVERLEAMLGETRIPG